YRAQPERDARPAYPHLTPEARTNSRAVCELPHLRPSQQRIEITDVQARSRALEVSQVELPAGSPLAAAQPHHFGQGGGRKEDFAGACRVVGAEVKQVRRLAAREKDAAALGVGAGFHGEDVELVVKTDPALAAIVDIEDELGVARVVVQVEDA